MHSSFCSGISYLTVPGFLDACTIDFCFILRQAPACGFRFRLPWVGAICYYFSPPFSTISLLNSRTLEFRPIRHHLLRFLHRFCFRFIYTALPWVPHLGWRCRRGALLTTVGLVPCRFEYGFLPAHHCFLDYSTLHSHSGRLDHFLRHYRCLFHASSTIFCHLQAVLQWAFLPTVIPTAPTASLCTIHTPQDCCLVGGLFSDGNSNSPAISPATLQVPFLHTVYCHWEFLGGLPAVHFSAMPWEVLEVCIWDYLPGGGFYLPLTACTCLPHR